MESNQKSKYIQKQETKHTIFEEFQLVSSSEGMMALLLSQDFADLPYIH
jgi:hypothetical protein